MENKQPKKITYTYPTGQAIKMLYIVNRGEYKVFVDGEYNRSVKADDVIKGFASMTEKQKQSANVEFIY